MRKEVGIDFRIPVANLQCTFQRIRIRRQKQENKRLTPDFITKDGQSGLRFTKYYTLRRLDAKSYRRFQIKIKTRKHNDTSSEQFCVDMPND